MADTKHTPAVPPVEEDGVNYSGIGWFIVVLVGTTLVCQVLVWGLFRVMAWRGDRTEPARASLAAPVGTRTTSSGRMVTGAQTEPAVPLLVSEPTVLKAFRDSEDAELKAYGWENKGAQVVRLPIDRAKDLLIERGLPVRQATASGEKPAAASEKKK